MIDMDDIIKAALAVRLARDDLAMAEEDLRVLLTPKQLADRWVRSPSGRWAIPHVASSICMVHSGGYDWSVTGKNGHCKNLGEAKAAAEACL